MGRKIITREFLLEKLREASEEFGPKVSVSDMKKAGRFPAKGSYQKYFGGFNEAKVLLNLRPNANQTTPYIVGGVKVDRAPQNIRHRATPTKQRFEILQRDGFRCVYCGREPKDGVKLVVDHVNPFSKGGSGENENLVTSCHECNMGKQDMILDASRLPQGVARLLDS